MVRPAQPVRFVRGGHTQLTPDLLDSATLLLGSLVSSGAALGWVEPPSAVDVSGLLREVADEAARDDATLVLADFRGRLLGIGYWRRYARPTHRPNADVQKVAVDPSFHRQGVGRGLMTELIASAADAGIETLTLDLRGDNAPAAALYESLGFRRYGVLEGFVAVGESRYDKLCYALDLRRDRERAGRYG